MTGTIAIPDPISALMLTELKVDELGRVYRRRDLRRRQRRFQQQARIRRLLG